MNQTNVVLTVESNDPETDVLNADESLESRDNATEAADGIAVGQASAQGLNDRYTPAKDVSMAAKEAFLKDEATVAGESLVTILEEAARDALVATTMANTQLPAANMPDTLPDGNDMQKDACILKTTLKIMIMGMQGVGCTKAPDAIRCDCLQLMLTPLRPVKELTVNLHAGIKGNSSIRHIEGLVKSWRGFQDVMEKLVEIGFYPEVVLLDYYWLQVIGPCV
jgi:hypothetical protein